MIVPELNADTSAEKRWRTSRAFTPGIRSLILLLLVCIPIITQAGELKMLVSWPRPFVMTKELAIPFAEALMSQSDGDIQVRIYSPEVVPPFEQLEPVQAGAFDLLYTNPAYHAGTTSIGLTIEAVSRGAEFRRRTGIWDAYDRHYQTLGLKLLAIIDHGARGYQIVHRDYHHTPELLAGNKIRGTISYHPVIRALGGVPVLLPLSDVYSALEKGVIDGLAFPSVGLAQQRLYEVTSTLLRPTFGTTNTLALMNLAKWHSLSPAEQEIILQVGIDMELRLSERMEALAAEEETFLISQGMRVAELGQPHASELEDYWVEGLWALARRKSPDAAARVFAIVERAELDRSPPKSRR